MIWLQVVLYSGPWPLEYTLDGGAEMSRTERVDTKIWNKDTSNHQQSAPRPSRHHPELLARPQSQPIIAPQRT